MGVPALLRRPFSLKCLDEEFSEVPLSFRFNPEGSHYGCPAPGTPAGRSCPCPSLTAAPASPSTGGPRPLAGHPGGAALGGQPRLDPVLLAFLVVVDVLVPQRVEASRRLRRVLARPVGAVHDDLGRLVRQHRRRQLVHLGVGYVDRPRQVHVLVVLRSERLHQGDLLAPVELRLELLARDLLSSHFFLLSRRPRATRDAFVRPTPLRPPSRRP